MGKTPIPGYGIVVLDSSQLEHVDFQGDDRFDTPQTGKLVFLRDEDKGLKIKDYSEMTFGDVLEKKVYWRKYADQDATFEDDDMGKVVFIKLEAIVGYE